MDQNSKRLYEFGPFRVDPEREVLLRDDEAIPLAPKAFQVLLLLVRNSKQVVTKDDLMKTIWPDTFVEETNLSRNIFLLRKALGESRNDRQYIVTVPGRGYRFVEDVQLVPKNEAEIVARGQTQLDAETGPETASQLEPRNDARLESRSGSLPESRNDSRVGAQVQEHRPWRWIAAGVVLAAAAAALSVLRFRHGPPPVLTARSTVVLADFTNATGDPIFEGTLRQGLATQLEQSPFLSIMDDAQLQSDLRLMNLEPGARISSQIAHDVCIREGGAATIDASIANLGKSYVITVQGIACRAGTTLARAQVQAANKEDVLNALGNAATALRRKLGESLASIRELNQPLEQATTSSLEALQNYTAGLAVMSQGHFLAAVPLYERAIAIDPKFAMAYYLMAVAYEQAGDVERSAAYAGKAFSLVDRVSESERVDVTAYYYRATGELDKEVDAYQLAARNYPDRWSTYNQLSLIENDRGRFEEGLEEGQKALRLQPSVEPPYRRVLDAYMSLDRLPDADRIAAEARGPAIDGSRFDGPRVDGPRFDGPRLHQRFLELAYIEDNQPAIAREIRWFSGKPEEYLSFGLQAAALNVHGQRRAAHKQYLRAAQAARHLGFGYVADEFEEADARAGALSGECETARVLGRPALALAICGEIAPAKRLAAKTSNAFPHGTIWNAVQLPEIEAVIALRRGDPAASVELLASASPYERAYPDAVYVRGLAYLEMHEGLKAAAEFQSIVDHKGANWGATWVHPNWGQYYALSYLGAARGFALAGEAAQAKRLYEEFFALWSDADPELPVLHQAKREYAELK